MTIQTEEDRRAFSRHECEKAPNDLLIEFNDWGIRIPSLPLPQDMGNCPFCSQSFFAMRNARFKAAAEALIVATPEEVAPVVADMVLRLEQPDFPQNAICNHFGPARIIKGLLVNLANRGPHLQATLYQDHVYRPAALHRARAEACSRALTTSILYTWNGGEGHFGISVVFRRAAPEGLLLALENYRKQKDVFRPNAYDKAGYSAFDNWYNRAQEEHVT